MNTQDLVTFENGMSYKFEAPKIETEFYFGYGIHAQREYSEIEPEMNALKTNENIFIEKNLTHAFKGIDKQIELARKHWPIYAMENGQSCWLEGGHVEQNRVEYITKAFKATPLSDADLDTLADAVQLQKAKFQKRLNAYLKRYGLTKVKTKSYYAD